MAQDARPGPRGVRDTVAALRGLTSDPCPTLDALVADHGPTFVVRGGLVTLAVVGDPAHLAPLLAMPTDSFRWGHRFNVLGFIVGPGSMIVSDGDAHRRRRGVTQPGFARRRLDGWGPLIIAETDRLIDETLLAARPRGPLPARSHPRASHRRPCLVWRRPRRPRRRARSGARTGDDVRRAARVAAAPTPLPAHAARRSAGRLRAADRIIYEEIARRRRTPPNEDRPDVLDALLASDLSDSEIRDQTITLIAAGYDTTASALAWTVLRAARASDVWARLRAESDASLGSELRPSNVRDLTYADAVVRESLRLHPPGVFTPRQAVCDLALGDFAIKKGTMILWSPYVAGRLATVWKEPLEFSPERFVDPDDEQQTAFDAAWMPFGRGPRACIGFALAQMELTLVLARLAQRVDLELMRPDVPRPVGMIVNRPEGGVPARVVQRGGISPSSPRS